MNVDGLAQALGLGSARGARAMARAIGDGRKRVVALGEAIARALEEAGHEAIRARLERGRLALEDGVADALCASGLPDRSIAPLVLGECGRVVKNGGRVMLATAAGIVGRGPERQVLTALFMHAGFVGIEQQLVRGTAITIGRVRR